MNPIALDLILAKLNQKTQAMQTRVNKAAEVLQGPLDTAIATTDCEVVYQEGRVKLKHYPPEKGTRRHTPILIVYALINRETMLDLQPQRSVVQNFLDRGMDIYMVEWGYPTRKDRFLTIDDHVNDYMDTMVEIIKERHGIDQVNLMGICMGGTFSVIYAALHPQKVKNLVTTVTPTSFDTDKGLLNIWMKALQPGPMVAAFGNVPGGLLNMGFLLLNPARLMLDKYVGFFENMDNKEFVENFVRMEKWIFDSPDVPGETFRQFIEDCYQKNLLIQSRLMVGGRRVDLKRVSMPLLNIYAEFDHLVPPSTCDKLTSVVGSSDTKDICLKTGHIGIYVSSKYQKQFVPQIVQWLEKRETPPTPRPVRRGRGTLREIQKNMTLQEPVEPARAVLP
jgi:polyhydroxyalkanoate synthase